jgi:hypothetical protein
VFRHLSPPAFQTGFVPSAPSQSRGDVICGAAADTLSNVAWDPEAPPIDQDADALKAALIETRAKLSGAEALIAHQQLLIAKLRRELYGPRSERSKRLLDQLELQLEELAAAAAEERARAAAARIRPS